MAPDAAEFEVGEAGAPRLGEEAAAAAEGEIPAGAVALDAWSPAEVTAALSQWWNLGCLWFGPEWEAKAHELQQVSVLLAPRFDEWFPKGGAGDPGLVVLVLACVGTGITMSLARGPAIVRHWRRPYIAQQLQALQAQSQPAAAAEPAAASGAPAEPAAGTSGYRFPRDLAVVVEPGPEDSMAGLGI